MSVKRARRHARESTLAPMQELELIIGPGRDPSEFASDEVRRREYFKHRERLLAENTCGMWATDKYESKSPPLAATAAARREKAVIQNFEKRSAS
jgi:hypothetical protein